MNTITIIGHIGADPVVRFTSSGQKVTSFTVATNSRKGGADITVWFRVTVWGDRFDKMIAHLKKGSAIIVIGELQKPEIWTDKEGRPQVTLELTANSLHFSPLGKGQGQEGGQGAGAHSKGASQQEGFGEQTFTPASSYGTGQSKDSNEEEMPF
jgi:single-strand DNA-binding protein